MSDFRHRSDPACCVPCSSGDRYDKVYDYKIIGNAKVLCDTGKTNDIYEFIQSFADSCSIESILSRCLDVGALKAKSAQMLDSSNLPQSFLEFCNTRLRLESSFNRLPPDVRAKFGNSFDVYLTSLDANYQQNVNSSDVKATENSNDSEVKSDV